MPLTTNDDAPTKFPTPDYLTLDSFKRGVITLIDKSRLPRDALEQADNLFLVEDGQPSIRPGVDWFGVAMPNSAAIDGFDYFDFAGVIHLVAAAGGNIYRSTDDGASWTICTGATYTAGKRVNMNQYNNYLHLTDGVDNIIRYDGSTTLQAYVALTTPAAPTIVETGSGLTSGTSYQYYFKTSAVNTVGFSTASAASTVIQTGLPRESWSAGVNYATVTVPAFQATQTRADIYISEDNLNFYYLGSTSNTTFVDDGTNIVNPSSTAPAGNTSQGPLLEELTNVGSRMYGVRDTVNKYRIWFTSGNNPKGSFSNAYDGGYLDWQLGGKYFPVHVEDYRDGKGSPLATIWCKSADGQGCVLQMSLDTVTVGDISITVPSAYKLPGSRGTPSPFSVVNVLNDYIFYNSQAVYNIGNRVNLQQILSTDEISANIRPTVRQISTAYEGDIASTYFDAKVYISAPFGSITNNTTMVYDTERKAWLPTAFTIGFKKFLRYTSTASDGSKRQHLLALKPGDNRLSEIASFIQGDYGVPFSTSLLTGLYPISKNRYEFQWTEEMEFEFSNPQGNIYVELLGIDRVKGYNSIKTVPVSIETVTVTTGWDTFAWDTTPWDDTDVVPETLSESSVKRYSTVQNELNGIQWHIYSNNLDSRYILRSLQTWGTRTEGGHPSSWRVNGI